MIEDTRLRLLRSDPAHKEGKEGSFHVFECLELRGHEVFELFPEMRKRRYGDEKVGLSTDIPTWRWLEDTFRQLGKDVDTMWNVIAAVWLLVTSDTFDSPRITLARRYLGIDPGYDLVADLVKWKERDAGSEQDELFVWGKCVYRKLLLQLVPLSSSRKESLARGNSLSFLDVCGFENLTTNGLQQYLINDCNDRLHGEYQRIALSHIPTAGATANKTSSLKTLNNALAVDPKAILLDRISGSNSVAGLRDVLGQNYRGSSGGSIVYDGRGSLVLAHSNGKIEYDFESFVADKTDGVRQDRMDACLSLVAGENKTPGQATAVRPTAQSRNVVKAYLTDWKTMRETLGTKHVLVIRCIKSHPQLEAWKCHPEAVRRQVESLGVIPMLSFLRDLPGQLADSVDDFWTKFGSIVGHTAGKSRKDLYEVVLDDGRTVSSLIKEHQGVVYYSHTVLDAFKAMIAEAERVKRVEAETIARKEGERLARQESERLDREAKLEAQKIVRDEAEKASRIESERVVGEARIEAERIASEARIEAEKASRIDSEQTARRREEARADYGSIVRSKAEVDHVPALPDSLTSLPRPSRTVSGGSAFRRLDLGFDFTLDPASFVGQLGIRLEAWLAVPKHDLVTQHVLGLGLESYVQFEVESAMYTDIPTGRARSKDAHRFLELAMVQCRRDQHLAASLMLRRVLEGLKRHYVLLIFVSAHSPDGLQDTRATPLGIKIAESVRDRLDTLPEVWVKSASAIDSIFEEHPL